MNTSLMSYARYPFWFGTAPSHSLELLAKVYADGWDIVHQSRGTHIEHNVLEQLRRAHETSS